MAQANDRVLIIEVDLRRPRLASYLGIEGDVGLTDVLVGSVDFSAACQRWGSEEKGLWVLPAGHAAPNPGELLQSQAMHDLLGTVSGQFDRVLLDAPPLLPVNDAVELAKLVDKVMIVVGAGRVRQAELSESVARLSQVGIITSGFIFNGVQRSIDSAYGYNSNYVSRSTASSGK